MLPRLASAVACAVLLTLVAPTAAHAASRTFVDGAGDVWELQDQPSPVPDRDQGDIARTTFTHGAHRVVVRTRFVELNRVGRIFIFTQLRTNTGQVRGLSLSARPSHYRGRAVLETRRGATLKCAIGRRIDYARNVATVSVPRHAWTIRARCRPSSGWQPSWASAHSPTTRSMTVRRTDCRPTPQRSATAEPTGSRNAGHLNSVAAHAVCGRGAFRWVFHWRAPKARSRAPVA